jgi:epoxyqueuosine reductase QueG
MKRAKLPATTRNAAVVLGNLEIDDNVPSWIAARADRRPLVREHRAAALAHAVHRLVRAAARG